MKCTLEVAKEIKFFQRKWTKILYYNQSKGRRKVQCGIHINFTVESTINPKIFFGNPFRDSFHRFLYELVLRLEQNDNCKKWIAHKMILNDFIWKNQFFIFFNGSFPNRSAFPWSLSSPDSWNSLRMRSWLVFPFHSRTNSSGTTNDPSCRGFMKRSTRFFKACLEILATNGAIDDGSPRYCDWRGHFCCRRFRGKTSIRHLVIFKG